MHREPIEGLGLLVSRQDIDLDFVNILTNRGVFINEMATQVISHERSIPQMSSNMINSGQMTHIFANETTR